MMRPPHRASGLLPPEGALSGFGRPGAAEPPRSLPRGLTLRQVLEGTADRHPLQEAMVVEDQRISWQALRRQVELTAAALWRLGIRKGDHVGLMLGNSVPWVQVFYACASLGAVTVPINTRFRSEELAFCLEQADIKALVYTDRFLNLDFNALLATVEPAIGQQLPGTRLPRLALALTLGAAQVPAGARALEDALAAVTDADLAGARAEGEGVSPADLLLIQYTSGTTSFPKGVMLSHDNMLSDAYAVSLRMNVQASDRYFSIRPFFHVAGTTLSILVSLSTGCCLLTLPRFDVDKTLDILARERCTLTSGNDTIFLMLLGHPDFDPGKLQLRGGWAAAGPEVMQKIHDDMGATELCNAYGLSEASPNVVLSSWDDPLPLRMHGWMLPHEGVSVRIADEASGQALPPGTPGEIQVKGWGVMRGYYNMPEQTARTFTPDGWLKTGDLGLMNEEGRIRMVGRLKEIFRVGGENVAPTEVEGLILKHPAVALAQVVGVPDPRLGEVPAAFIVLKAGQTLEAQALLDWCRQSMANFKVPRYLQFVDNFEAIGMTGSSKIQKNKLRAHAIEHFQLNQGDQT